MGKFIKLKTDKLVDIYVNVDKIITIRENKENNCSYIRIGDGHINVMETPNEIMKLISED